MTEFYVDLSAANNGDGTDGAQAGAPAGVGAFNQLTAGETAGISDGDVVYIRRTATASTKALTFKFGTGPTPAEKIHYLGWPVNNADKHYAQAQASSNTVKATWDADPELFTVINPVASSWLVEYIRIARIHAEELGSGNNHFVNNSVSGTRDFTFYKCKASRATASVPVLEAHFQSTGMCEYDDVHVKGTTPNVVRCRGSSFSGSGLVRVRIEMTDAGSSSLNIGGEQPRTGVLEILEWIDSGNHWLTSDKLGHASDSFVFTTDDDAVGALPIVIGSSDFCAAGCSVIARNLTLDHSFATARTNGIRGADGGHTHYYENFTFHPTDHTKVIDISSSKGRVTGRNIKNFDASKVDIDSISNNTDVAIKSFTHFAQINGTEAWYRQENGCTAQISSVNRTGGAANAILVELSNRPIDLHQRGHHTGIFFSEFKGLEAFAFVKTGLGYPAAQTLTAYFAVANWDSIEDQDRIWYEVELYKNGVAGDYSRRLIDSRKLPPTQAFISDVSVWNGIFGYNAYRVEIPVTIEKDDIVKVRFFVRDTHLSVGLQRNLVVFDPAITLA